MILFLKMGTRGHSSWRSHLRYVILMVHYLITKSAIERTEQPNHLDNRSSQYSLPEVAPVPFPYNIVSSKMLFIQ